MKKTCDFLPPERQKRKFYLFLCMRMIAVLLLVGSLHLSAATFSQTKVSLTMKNAALEEIFQQLETMTDYTFLYKLDLLKGCDRVDVDVQEEDFHALLTSVLKPLGLSFTIDDRVVIIKKETIQPPVKKLKKIFGKVMDHKKSPIPGATVRMKGSVIGTATNHEGAFVLSVPDSGKVVLVFSFIGMETKEMDCTGKDSVNVVLKESASELEEVQVISTGYYDVDKRMSTSAVTSLKMDDIKVPGVNTIDQLLEGHVPGMIYMQNSGQVGASPKLKIRGTTTLLGSQQPLWVVDGVILSDPVNVDPQQINDIDFVNLLGNAISGLNPEDVEQIDILKDASATAVYGPQASNGVIVITTKKGKIGKPSVSYSVSGSVRQRPRYSDKGVYVMNSMERIDYSREIVDKKLQIADLSSHVGYEAAALDLYNGVINYDEFNRRVAAMETANTDWFGILLKDAISHNHTLSLSGGSENMRYYASLGFQDENGNIKGEKNDRYSTRMNLTVTQGKFNMQFSIAGNLQKKEYTPKNVNIMNYAYNTSRSVQAYDEKGDLWFYQRRGPNAQAKYDTPFSIINERDNTYNKIKTSQLQMNISLNYNFLLSLKGSLQFSYNHSQTDDETYFGEETWYAAGLRYFNLNTNAIEVRKTLLPKGGELRMDGTQNENYSLRAQLTYNRFLDKEHNHNLVFTATGELSSRRYTGFAITRRGYMPDRGLIFDPVRPTDPKNPYKAYDEWMTTDEEALGKKKDELTNLVALVGVLSWSYKMIYTFNVNARIDASNKFGDQSNKKLLPIWYASGRWNIHENLLQNFWWVNEMGLRFSFGYQGNMSAQNSPDLQIKKAGINDFFKAPYATVYSFPNPFLKWEKTMNVNAGLNFALFKNKLSGSVDWYYRYTSDAYMSKSVSTINGMKKHTVNRGTLKNTGFDFSFRFEPINTMINKLTSMASVSTSSKRGFVWRFNPNFGAVFNQLLNKVNRKQRELEDEITFQNYLDGDVYLDKKPVSTFYSYRFKGLSPENGAPMFYGTDEFTMVDGKEVSTKELYESMEPEEVFFIVMEESGTREPFLQGGISNYFGWGNWGLSFSLAYSFGNKIRLFKMYPYETVAPGPETNLRREFVNRWKQPGDEQFTNIPGLLTVSEYQKTLTPWWRSMEKNTFASNIWKMYDQSNLRTVSGNYLKLQNISLRYVVPDKLCRKLYLKSAYVNLSGSNIFTWASKELKGQEPTQSGTSQQINISVRPMYSFQLNLTF